MSQRSTSTYRHRRQHAPGHHGRIYIFLVVALTVFLGGIVLWRRPADECTARITLVHREGDEKTTAGELVEMVGSDLAIHDVTREMSWADAHAVRPRLLIDAHPAPRPGETTIDIWFKHRSPDKAKAMTKGLAEHFVQALREAEQAAAPCSACVEEKALVARVQAEVKSARETLTAFERQHAGKYSTRLDGSTKPAEASHRQPAPVVGPEEMAVTPGENARPQPPGSNSTAAHPGAAQPLNPEWVELDDRLQVLRAARDELLTKRTDAHPEVRDLQWQIDELEKKLTLVRRTIGPPPEETNIIAAATSSPELAPLDLPTEQPQQLPPAPTEIVQQYRRLLANAAAAEHRLEEAQRAERDAQMRHQHRVFAQAEITDGVRIVSQHGGGVSRSGMAFAGLIAFAVGLLATWRSQVKAQPAELISASQIERLGVPVVAAIRTGDGPVLPPPQTLNPGWIRWTTFTCELALAAIALTMLLLALAEWHIAAGLLRDPLSTLSEAFGRLGR